MRGQRRNPGFEADSHAWKAAHSASARARLPLTVPAPATPGGQPLVRPARGPCPPRPSSPLGMSAKVSDRHFRSSFPRRRRKMSRQAARLTRRRSRVGPSVIKTRPGCVLPSAAAPLTSSGARLLMRTPANYSQSDGESTLGQAMGLGGGPSAASQASRPAGALSLLGTVTLLADGAPRLGAQGRADGGSAGSSLSPSPEDTQGSHTGKMVPQPHKTTLPASLPASSGGGRLARHGLSRAPGCWAVR